MLQDVKEKIKTREAKRFSDQAYLDLLKISVPAFNELQRLAESIGEVAKSADSRLESFDATFPFFGYQRSQTSPIFLMLSTCLNFLSHNAMDYELRRAGVTLGDDWSDGGPGRLRRLVLGRSNIGAQEEYEDDWKGANTAYRALLRDLVPICKPVLKPIEHFSRTASDVYDRSRAFTRDYSGVFQIGNGYGVPLVGLAQTLMRNFLGIPGARDVISSDKGLDFGYWLRLGQAPLEPMPAALKREFEPLILRVRRLEGLLLKE